MTRTAATSPDATLAYYTPASRPAKATTPAGNPAQAALDLMFGYFEQK
jgi:hypothetical protein